MDIQSFFEHCDDLLNRWSIEDRGLETDDAFLAIQKEGKGLLTKEYFGTMPEPFWGNPDCCSVVMINLNPAYKEGHESLFSRENTKKRIPNGYSSFAKGFPILDENSYNPEGRVWWEGRKKYLDRLVDAYPRKKHPDEKRLPFAIEICPWQTATWQETMASILVAGCSNICNEVANVKMGNAHSGEDINYIESPYSKKSFQDFIDNILSIQYSLYGKAGATAPESKSLINILKNYKYDGADALQTKLSESVNALKECQKKGAFVDIYRDNAVQDAMDIINELDEELNKAAQWIVKQ